MPNRIVLNKLLKNPTLRGEVHHRLRYGGSVLDVEAQLEAIFEPELAARIDAAIDRNRHGGGRSDHQPYPLSRSATTAVARP